MEPFLAEILTFGFNFAPRGWAMCDGQILPINYNQALFSLLGTTFGGDGRTSFALPDLRGRTPVHPGSDGFTTALQLGQRAGSEYVTATVANLPSHTHSLRVSSNEADLNVPTGAYFAADNLSAGGSNSYINDTPDTSRNAAEIGNTGGNQEMYTVSPYQVLNVCIALQGLFPSRS